MQEPLRRHSLTVPKVTLSSDEEGGYAEILLVDIQTGGGADSLPEMQTQGLVIPKLSLPERKKKLRRGKIKKRPATDRPKSGIKEEPAEIDEDNPSSEPKRRGSAPSLSRRKYELEGWERQTTQVRARGRSEPHIPSWRGALFFDEEEEEEQLARRRAESSDRSVSEEEGDTERILEGIEEPVRETKLWVTKPRSKQGPLKAIAE